MIRISSLSLARGGRRLLENAALTLHVGQKVGLIGANGSGKSSLLALLRGEIDAEAGDVSLPPSWVIAHVAQEVLPLATPAIEFVLDGDSGLRAVERALSEAEADPSTPGEHLADLHHRYEAIDGYSARARAATLLSGLGFAPSRHGESVASFSGAGACASTWRRP